MPKQVEAKRDGIINPQGYNFISINFDTLKTLTIDRSRNSSHAYASFEKSF